MPHQKSTEAVWLSTLAYIIGCANHQLDANRNHVVAFDDIYDGLETGELWNDLEKMLSRFDIFGLLGASPSDQGAHAMDVLKAIADYRRDHEANKCGVSKDGLSLLIAFCVEAINDHKWIVPSQQTASSAEWK